MPQGGRAGLRRESSGESATRAPRRYLRATDRRAQLLRAATELVARDGLASLTMSGVASEAGVSRQWVHEHFDDLAGLYEALLLDRFAALDAEIDRTARTHRGADLALAVSRLILDLPPSDLRILRAAVDGAGTLRPELAPVEAHMRERILRRWEPAMQAPGRTTAEARAIIWAIVTALFGLADQITRDSTPPRRSGGARGGSRGKPAAPAARAFALDIVRAVITASNRPLTPKD